MIEGWAIVIAACMVFSVAAMVIRVRVYEDEYRVLSYLVLAVGFTIAASVGFASAFGSAGEGFGAAITSLVIAAALVIGIEKGRP
jgi:uncharacterized membrane protein